MTLIESLPTTLGFLTEANPGSGAAGERGTSFGPIPGLGGTVRWQIVADRGLGSGQADYYSRFSAVTRII
jgi:hypothetical protein